VERDESALFDAGKGRGSKWGLTFFGAFNLFFAAVRVFILVGAISPRACLMCFAGEDCWSLLKLEADNGGGDEQKQQSRSQLRLAFASHHVPPKK
jgi:hypothetical protein